MAILLKECNVVSLRTAYISDDGNLVCFRLSPLDILSTAPHGKKWWAPKDFDWVLDDSVWLYRHMRSPAAESKLMRDFPCVDQDVKPMKFRKSPEFRLLWTDSGHSVALYLNGEPWAFICEETHEGFSKGILMPIARHLPSVGRLWDQSLFEETFLNNVE